MQIFLWSAEFLSAISFHTTLFYGLLNKYIVIHGSGMKMRQIHSFLWLVEQDLNHWRWEEPLSSVQASVCVRNTWRTQQNHVLFPFTLQHASKHCTMPDIFLSKLFKVYVVCCDQGRDIRHAHSHISYNGGAACLGECHGVRQKKNTIYVGWNELTFFPQLHLFNVESQYGIVVQDLDNSGLNPCSATKLPG